MTLPNWISVGRILLIPVFMVVLLGHVRGGDYLAVAVFALAAVTDKLDGYLARSRGSTSTFGIFLDPLADKLLVSAALISLVELGRLAAWVAMVIIAREFMVSGLRMVIIAREFMVSGLRMVAASQNQVIAASQWGKIKTTVQVVAIAAVIVDNPPHTLTTVLVAAAVAATVWSGIEYFIDARDVLRSPA